MSRPRAAPKRHFAEGRGVHVGVEGHRQRRARGERDRRRRCRASPALGVEVMKPKRADAGWRSTGPNEPMPTAPSGPCRACCSRKKRSTSPRVFGGRRRREAHLPADVVGTAAHDAHELGAARFDSAEEHRLLRSSRAGCSSPGRAPTGAGGPARPWPPSSGSSRSKRPRRVDAVGDHRLPVVGEDLEGGPIEQDAERRPVRRATARARRAVPDMPRGTALPSTSARSTNTSSGCAATPTTTSSPAAFLRRKPGFGPVSRG